MSTWSTMYVYWDVSLFGRRSVCHLLSMLRISNSIVFGFFVYFFSVVLAYILVFGQITSWAKREISFVGYLSTKVSCTICFALGLSQEGPRWVLEPRYLKDSIFRQQKCADAL